MYLFLKNTAFFVILRVSFMFLGIHIFQSWCCWETSGWGGCRATQVASALCPLPSALPRAASWSWILGPSCERLVQFSTLTGPEEARKARVRGRNSPLQAPSGGGPELHVEGVLQATRPVRALRVGWPWPPACWSRSQLPSKAGFLEAEACAGIWGDVGVEEEWPGLGG